MPDTTRMRELCDDWDQYSKLIKDPDWTREMQRTVVAEMEIEMERFRQLCRMTRPGSER